MLKIAMRPRLLRPDNLTPPTRTPWGGRVIAERIKCGLDYELPDDTRIGESWEISTEPSFPSRFADDGQELRAAIQADPDAWLGRDTAARYHGQNPILVKLLDAADDLSVQVHPALDDPALAADESGKPESWYILAATPQAGLYLGFREGVDRPQVESCLRDGGALSELMNFVPVAPGDAFCIGAGLPHAVGAGVTLVEPQFVSPGRRGLTYRFWDWNRRYDQNGRLAEDGAPRELHVDRSLAVTRWDAPRGLALVDDCRSTRQRLSAVAGTGSVRRERIIDWSYFAVERWAGAGTLELEPFGTMLAVVCVAGAAQLATPAGALAMERGESAVVPAAAGAIQVASRRHRLDGDVEMELLVTHVRDA